MNVVGRGNVMIRPERSSSQPAFVRRSCSHADPHDLNPDPSTGPTHVTFTPHHEFREEMFSVVLITELMMEFRKQ